MNKLVRYSALAAFIGAGLSGVAHADSASTTGGLKIKSDDGNFEAAIGGRIHFDGALISADDDANALGISKNGGKNASSFYFRRVFITLTGKAYGWDYHIDDDISADGSGAGFNDVWLAHDVFGHDHIYFGQHKPWRSLDEMASNNNLALMERNILSANGLFGGRDFTNGIYYKYVQSGFWGGASFYTDSKQGKTAGRSFGTNFRVAYAPIAEKTQWLHVGASYSFDNVSPDGDGYAKLAPGYSTWYAKKGAGVTLVSFAGSGVGTASPNNVSGSTGTFELAGAFGPAFFQGEYGVVHQWEEIGKAATVDAYSVTVAYALTGETRSYSAGDASYGGIKPSHSYGAVEVAARYDSGKNKDEATCGFGTAGTQTKCSVSTITAGVNYYVNPNVRFMLNYEHGKADDGVKTDSPDAVMARAQFAF